MNEPVQQFTVSEIDCAPLGSGIYRIACIVTGKVYVGSAVSIRKRFRSHRNELLRGRHGNGHLQCAWNKYGAASFIFEIVEMVEPTFLIQCEQTHIDRYSAADRFNIAPTAGSQFGMTMSPESRARISAGLLRMAPETRARVSAAQSVMMKNQHQNAGTRAKRAAAMMGNQYGLGCQYSAEEKARRAARMRGRVVSVETRAKLSAIRKGMTASPETRTKMSAARIGKVQSAETVAKRAATLRALHAFRAQRAVA